MADSNVIRGNADTDITVTSLGAIFVIYFAAALLPRLSLILAGAAYADDWAGISYVAHLESYRPLAALELWIWQSLFGPEYLTTWMPRIWSSAWYSLAMTLLLAWTRGLGVPLYLGGAIGLVVLLHPAFNELILWGVLTNVALGTACAGAGVLLAYRGGSASMRAIGIGLVCAASVCQQMLAVFGAVSVAMEIATSGYRVIQREGLRGWIWRGALILLPITIGIAVLLIMRNWLGYQDFASRSLGFSAGMLQSKFFVLTNSYANVFQGPLGWAVGNALALRAFWPALVIPVIAIFLMLRLGGLSMFRSVLLALLPVGIFWLAMAPLLGTNATPTGFRVMGPALIAMSIASSIALAPLWYHRKGHLGLMIIIAALATCNLGATLVDTSVRSQALERDKLWLADAKAQIAQYGAPRVQLCSSKFEPRRDASESSRGILVSYNVAAQDQYSEWYSPFFAHYLIAKGIDAKVPRFGESDPACATACEGHGDFKLGPFDGRFDASSMTRFVCEHREGS